MPTTLNERYNAFRFDGLVEEEGSRAKHDGPHPIHTEEDLWCFLEANVAQYPEIRIVDSGDYTVVHVVNQSLIFPMPNGCTTRNRWNPEAKKFVEPQS